MEHTVSCELQFLCPCDSQEHPCSPTLPKKLTGISLLYKASQSNQRGENSPAFHSHRIRALSPMKANFQPFSSLLEFMNAKAARPQTNPSRVFRHSQVCQPQDSTAVGKSYTHSNSEKRSSWQSCQAQHPREAQLERCHSVVPAAPTSHTLLGALPNCCAQSKPHERFI